MQFKINKKEDPEFKKIVPFVDDIISFSDQCQIIEHLNKTVFSLLNKPHWVPFISDIN